MRLYRAAGVKSHSGDTTRETPLLLAKLCDDWSLQARLTPGGD